MKKNVSAFLFFCFITSSGFTQITEPPRGRLTSEEYINMLVDSLTIAESTRNTINIIRYSAVLTTQLQYASKHEQASAYLRKAFHLAGKQRDPKWYADVCNRAGMLMLSLAQKSAGKKSSYVKQMFDSSMYWHRQAVSKALAIGRSGTAGWGYRGLLNTARLHYSDAVMDSVPFFYNKAIEMAIATADMELVQYANSHYKEYLQKVSKTKGDNMAEHISRLRAAETTKDTAGIINAALELTTDFQTAQMIDRATYYLPIALQYAEAYSDATLYPVVCNRAGMLMRGLADRQQGKKRIHLLDSSLYWFRQTTRIANKTSDTLFAGWGYLGVLNIAIIHPDHTYRDSIPIYYNKAVRSAKSINDQSVLVHSSTSYCVYLNEIGDWQTSKAILTEMSVYFDRMAPHQKNEYLLTLHQYLSKVNHLDTLLTVHSLFLDNYDKIVASRHGQELYAKDQQYEVSKTRDVLDATEGKLAITNKVLIASAAVIILFMVLITYLFFLFRKNKKLSLRNELLLKEQNHRVKNNLQMISSLLSLQSEKLQSPDARDVLENSQSRINSVALLHRMLYEGERVGDVDVAEYLRSLTEEIKFSASRGVEIGLDLPGQLQLKIEKVTSLGLILNELLSNSIKHVSRALSLRVTIRLSVNDDGLHLTYTDNGEGVMPDRWMSSVSFGNQLIQIQSQQLRGEFAVSVADGFKYDLSIPA